MLKTLTTTAAAILFASTAIASDAPYDKNEAFSPEMVELIKATYANDFADNTDVAMASLNEAWSQDAVAMIKAAFANGS